LSIWLIATTFNFFFAKLTWNHSKMSPLWRMNIVSVRLFLF